MSFFLVGCARWSPKPDAEASNGLPPPKKSLDSVVVETVLVRFPLNKVAELNSIWQRTDESLLDIDQRQLLDKNGLRVGRVLGDLPKPIRDQIEFTSKQQTTDALEHAGLAADVDGKMHKLQCRAGRRKDLMVRRELSEPLTVLSTRDGDTVTGETFAQPAVLFDLRAIPHGDGQATIELTPEIQHGAHRQAFVSTDLGVRPELKRAQVVWRELRIEAKLTPGAVLVVGATEIPKALGKAFFTTETAERTEERVVLLVRLAETQLDELFAPESVETAAAMTER